MISLNTNLTDLILLNNLGSSTFGVNKAIEHLTTGYKLNHAKDNAANLSIVTNLSSRISSLLKLNGNTEDGISLLSTAQGALENIQDQLARLRALSVQAASGNYGKQSLDAMQAEADAIIEQIKQIRNNTEFNGLKLFEAPRDEAITKLVNAKVKSRTASTPSLQADDTISGAFDFAASETKTITIDGVNYTIKNKENVVKTLSYSKDRNTGELTLYMNYFEVHAQEDVAHNLKVVGSYNVLYGGNLNDIIHITGPNSNSSIHNDVYAGGGDDTLISDCTNTDLYGQDGNDNFVINSGAIYAYGGDGDDTFHIGNVWKANAFGEAGEDRFYIEFGAIAYVDGGSGINYAENKSSNATLINVPNANALVETFAAKETKTITVGGSDYLITNNINGEANFLYSITADGTLEVKSKNFTIRGDEDQKNSILISAALITYYAGNKGDKIVSKTSDSIIYGGKGDDDITVTSYSTVEAGEGNNIINVSGGHSFIKTGNGDNTIIISTTFSTSVFELGDGNNTIQNAQNLRHCTVAAGSGKNTLTGGDPLDSMIYGFGSSDNALAFDVPDTTSGVININGTNYTVSSNTDVEVKKGKKLLYNYNAVTGIINFGGQALTIEGDENKSHNVVLQGGKSLWFYGGKYDDTITNYAYGGRIYGQEGNDTLISNFASDCNIYGGDGDDIITTKYANVYGGDGDDIINIEAGHSSAYKVSGEDGNDTYNINSASSIIDNLGNNIYNINADNASITGGSGDDTYYIKGNNNIVLGAGGNDYFVIDGNNNTIDGGTGNNFYIDNGTNTTITNVNKDPNSGMLVFTYLGEVKTFVLDGKTYTVTNDLSGNNQLRYSYNPNTKTITLDGSSLTVDSVLDKSHKLNIRGDNNTINGGNLADIITIESGSNNIINALDGDDTINMNSDNNAVNGGDGNDTITLNSSTNKLINGGNGDDTIIVNSSNNTNINSGEGNNKITLNGGNNTLELSNGNNLVNVRSDNNKIKAENGDNTFSVAGSSNNITSGIGNNKVGIDGDNNTINASMVTGDVNILGDGNTYVSQNGEEKIIVNGSNNNVNSGSGNDKLEIRGDGNTIVSTSGDNNVNLRGDTNSYQGGSGIDKITISGNGNSANGGEANDEFIVSGGTGNIIDGEAGGRNTMINNGKNTTYTNVVDITPCPFELMLKVDLGSDENSFINMSISFNLFDFYLDFSNPDNLSENLDKIDDLASQVEEQLVNIGSVINRLESVLESQSIQMENLLSTRSTLRDADIAKESSDLIKYEILQQASATLMAATRNLNREFLLGILGV